MKIPKTRLAFVFSHSLFLSALFVFTAWKAIDENDPYLKDSCAFVQASVSPDQRECQTETRLGMVSSMAELSPTAKENPVITVSLLKQKVELKGDGGNKFEMTTSPKKDMARPFYNFTERYLRNPIQDRMMFAALKTLPDWDYEKKGNQVVMNSPALVDIPSRSSVVSNRIDFGENGSQTGAPGQFFAEQCYTGTLHCGQIVTGDNYFRDSLPERYQDCANGAYYGYIGRIWYRIIGTGDFINLRASSTGDYAEIHLYQAKNGNCDSLQCIDGAYPINGSEQVIPFQTIAGQEYFVMMAHWEQRANQPNMSYYLYIDCICGNYPLFYSAPHSFDSTHTAYFSTDNTITANNQIGNGAQITYNADQGVTLNSTFEVQKGALFQILLNGCPISSKTTNGPDPDNFFDWYIEKKAYIPPRTGID